MAVLRKCDVAVTLEAAGFSITNDGPTFLLNESAEIFSVAWRELNREQHAIFDACDRAGPDVDRQFDVAVDVIHGLVLALGIEPAKTTATAPR